jgi:SAM-dependent methyltransferase
MSAPADSDARDYDSMYGEFDSPLMRRLRRDAYGEDVGQHSWVTADELRGDVRRLRLTSTSRLLDLGCGACGPLTFVLRSVGCPGTGVERSGVALAAGRARAAELGVDHLLALHEADLDAPIPLPSGSFEAVMALDVVLHVRDRGALFGEVARTLARGGRFLFTDAGVVTGAVSDDEIRRRSAHGHTQFVAPGFNERLLARSGLQVLETENRTASVLTHATGRLAARLAHREALERLEGEAGFERQQQYLETVVEISRRGAVSRHMILAEAPRA